MAMTLLAAIANVGYVVDTLRCYYDELIIR